jgi:hypothetical protein
VLLLCCYDSFDFSVYNLRSGSVVRCYLLDTFSAESFNNGNACREDQKGQRCVDHFCFTAYIFSLNIVLRCIVHLIRKTWNILFHIEYTLLLSLSNVSYLLDWNRQDRFWKVLDNSSLNDE